MMADPDWALQSPRENSVGENTSTTLEFVRMVSQAENLVAILTGHCHFRHADAVNPWVAQYLAPPGYAGEYWLFRMAAIVRKRHRVFWSSTWLPVDRTSHVFRPDFT